MSEGELPSNLPADAHDLGPNFEPYLLEACDGRLAEIRWFRTGWQRGGAATGYAKAVRSDGVTLDAVVKFPIGPREYKLLVELSETDAPTPRVAFHGRELGPFDLAWVVMENLPGEPLKRTYEHPDKKLFTAVAEAACRFYAASADRLGSETPPKPWDFAALITKSRESCKHNPIPEVQRWAHALHDVAKYLDAMLSIWKARTLNTWCHGDLHLANIMERPSGSPWAEPHHGESGGGAASGGRSDGTGFVLLDFGEVHQGHWVEDAVYLERIYWANPEVSKKVKFVPLFARARKAAGLDCSDDYAKLAQIRRVLMASCAPAWLHRENHPLYLNAALEVIEKTLPGLIDR